MIFVKDQYMVLFTLGTFYDFISPEHFISMQIKENAGGLRPILNLCFELEREDIIPYLNAGNIITMQFGLNDIDSHLYLFEICSDSNNKEYTLHSTVHLTAVMYNPTFMNESKDTQYVGKSYEVLQLLASDSKLDFITNVTKTNDSQTWYQMGKTNWEFTNYIWQRSYRDSDTFFAYALDSQVLYFYDVKQLLNSGPKWCLSPNAAGNDDKTNAYVNISNYICDGSPRAYTNGLIGKNVNTISYNIDTGEFSNHSANLKTFTTLDTNKINMNTSGCKTYNYKITSSCDHNNALFAIDQNTKNNLLFSSYDCYVPIAGQYRDFKLLDVCLLLPGNNDDAALGFYIITAIQREIQNLQLRINLTLNRESMNGIKGTYLDTGA